MSTRLLVADSGPLIALARLELLLLPSRLYAEVLVTETVWDEVTRAPRPSQLAVLLAAQKDGLFNVVADPATMAFELNGLQLDPGEQTALSMALFRQGRRSGG